MWQHKSLFLHEECAVEKIATRMTQLDKHEVYISKHYCYVERSGIRDSTQPLYDKSTGVISDLFSWPGESRIGTASALSGFDLKSLHRTLLTIEIPDLVTGHVRS